MGFFKNRLNGLFRTQTEAEKVVDYLPELEEVAKRVASTIMMGLRNQPKAGPGIEFHEFQPYDPNQHDIKQIDHKQSAKLGTLVIRNREAQKHHSYYLWRDNRAGMNWHAALTEKDANAAEDTEMGEDTSKYTKRQIAEILLLATSHIVTNAEERVTMLGTDKRPGTHTRGIVDQLAEAEYQAQAPWKDLGMTGRPLPARSHVIIFSDFLPDAHNSADDMVTAIEMLAARGVRGHLVQVLDPAEIEFPFNGNTEFNHAAGGERIRFGRAEMYRAEYQAALQAHIERIARAAADAQWGYTLYRTDAPLHTALEPIYEQGGAHNEVPNIISTPQSQKKQGGFKLPGLK